MSRSAGVIITAFLAAVLITGVTASAAQAATSDAMSRAPVTDIAHRGASHDAPENTVAAFREARTRHADMFEIDVQQTRDGALVLMHDTTLARTTNAEKVFPKRSPWKVSDFTLAEIRKLDAGSWFGSRFRGERVPTLDETLVRMRSAELGLLLEVKAPELYPQIGQRIVKQLLQHRSWSRPDPRGRRLVVQSFDWEFMRDFKQLMPWVPAGLLGTPTVDELPQLSSFADQINPGHTTLTADYVARVHELGMEVFTWTVDDAAGMRRAIDLGVDGIITNRPDVLRKIIDRRVQVAA